MPPQPCPTIRGRGLAERADQPGDVPGERPQVVAARGLVGVAVAAQVDGDRAEPRVGQRGQLVPPRSPELGEAVQQHDERAPGRRTRRRAAGCRSPTPSGASTARGAGPTSVRGRPATSPRTAQRSAARRRRVQLGGPVGAAPVLQHLAPTRCSSRSSAPACGSCGPAGSRGARTAPAASTMMTKTMANAAHRGSQIASSSARVKNRKNRLNSTIASGDDEEDAARDSPSYLGGDLGAGQLHLGAHERGDCAVASLTRLADRLLDRGFAGSGASGIEGSTGGTASAPPGAGRAGHAGPPAVRSMILVHPSTGHRIAPPDQPRRARGLAG